MTDINAEDIRYRNTQLLEQFMDEYGRIKHRDDTGLSAQNQRAVKTAIKRARYLGMLPYTRA